MTLLIGARRNPCPPIGIREKTMKGIKTNFLLILVLMLMFTYPACAEELSEGYIVKLSSNAVVLFSAESDEITTALEMNITEQKALKLLMKCFHTKI